MDRTVAVLGTLDTKGLETQFVKKLIENRGAHATDYRLRYHG